MRAKLKNILLLYTDGYYLIKQVYPFGLDILANHLRQYGYEVAIEYPFLPEKDIQSNLDWGNEFRFNLPYHSD